MRLLRLVKTAEMFDTLMLMVGAIKSSFAVVFWGFCLIGGILIIMSMGLQSEMENIILDESLPTETRHDAFNFFGTFTRSCLSLFEVILGNWVPLARFMATNMGEFWAYFILILRIFVDFSVVRVVSAVIMHETFRCASLDDELMIQTKARAQSKFAYKMKMLFDEADSTGDGTISLDEFKDIVGDQRVRTWLAAMDLNVRDPVGVFSYLVSKETFRHQTLTGHEEVSFEDLISGLARLRGQSLSCDVLSLMADMKVLAEKVEQNRDSTQRFVADMKAITKKLEQTDDSTQRLVYLTSKLVADAHTTSTAAVGYHEF